MTIAASTCYDIQLPSLIDNGYPFIDSLILNITMAQQLFTLILFQNGWLPSPSHYIFISMILGLTIDQLMCFYIIQFNFTFFSLNFMTINKR